MHTILGANGVIGRELSAALQADGKRVRQVSRSPRAQHQNDELVAADLLDARATADAVVGSEVAYLVAGLKYQTAVWLEEWPRVMRNVIDACKRHVTPLVFFDNVYAYGRVDGPMKEDTPFNPVSRKGAVRAMIAMMLLEEMNAGNIQAMIVRSADFYGPYATQSLTHSVIFDRLREGKAAQWIGNARALHTFTYTPDAGRAVAVLASSGDAWGHTWHAPTSSERMSGEEFARIACELASRPYRLQVAPRWMLALMGIVVPVLRENQEMMYQFEHDYRFDSTRTERTFGLTPTTYRAGIAATLKA